MTQVRIRPVRNGAGDLLKSRVSVYLVDQNGVRLISWELQGKTPATEFFSVPLVDVPLEPELLPTEQLAIDAGGSPVFYRVEIRVRHEAESWGETYWDVTVPDSPTPVELADLVGAQPIPPGSLLWDRLLPDPTSEPDNRWLRTEGGAWILTDGIPLTSLDSGDAADGAFLVADGVGGSRWDEIHEIEGKTGF